MKAESEVSLMRKLQLTASENGARLFRNNSGVGWAGNVDVIRAPRTVTVVKGDVVVRNARPLHAGLGTGSGDLIGWHPVVITPDMVGRRFALFSNIEVKSARGRPTEEQASFHKTVLDHGGISAIVRSQQEYFDAVSGLYLFVRGF